MSSSATFTGSGFRLESLEQIGPATLRIKYTNDPLALDAAGATDALNPDNYSLAGPATNTISSVTAVTGDPQSFDLDTEAPLIGGSWSVSVSNVVAG